MISAGNSKLGSIRNWSLPVLKTCPGASAICEKLCYASKGRAGTKANRDKYERNLTDSTFPNWVGDMIAKITAADDTYFRVHVAGDFYDADYVEKWRQIAQGCPKTTFVAYTRSWAAPGMLESLTQLASEPNFVLWFSTDSTMGQPPAVARVRIAYLSCNDTDVPAYPVDLVFRDKPKTLKKKMGLHNSWVCAYEQCSVEKSKVTCDRCRYCYRQRPGVNDVSQVSYNRDAAAA